MSSSLSNKNKVLAVSFDLQASIGRIPFVEAYNRSGFNPEISTNYEEVWETGGMQEYLSAAENVKVKSSSTADTLAGTGVRKTLVRGIDENFLNIEEEVAMNGSTPVETLKKFLRVFDLIVWETGSSLINQGVIDADSAVSNKSLNKIDTGNNSSRSVQFTVPQNKCFVLRKMGVFPEKKESAAILLRTADSDRIFRSSFFAKDWSHGHSEDFLPYIVFDPCSDVSVLAKNNAPGATKISISVFLQGFLVDESWKMFFNWS
jgi:hypothetical protein